MVLQRVVEVRVWVDGSMLLLLPIGPAHANVQVFLEPTGSVHHLQKHQLTPLWLISCLARAVYLVIGCLNVILESEIQRLAVVDPAAWHESFRFATGFAQADVPRQAATDAPSAGS